MNARRVFIIALALAVTGLVGCQTSSPSPSTFEVKSTSFQNGKPLPNQHTCEGKAFASGISPALSWKGEPKGTQSYAIVFADATLIAANVPNYAYHWAIWNIPANQRSLPEGISGVDIKNPTAIVALPANLKPAEHTQARGLQQFFGPCPSWKNFCTQGAEPRVEDTYSFTVFAMPDKKIVVPAYDPNTNPNYVDRLNAFFRTRALASTAVTATSTAAPISLPFPCPQ